MSSVEDKELKAGHPPAVKAGGMRITQKRTTSESEKTPPAANGEGEEEQVSTSPPKSERHRQEVLLQGVITKGDKDFPPEAVKQYHEKPLPSKDMRPVHKPHNIQQPR